MRRVARAGCAVMLSYLLQATVLPYLKVRGAQPELILVVLFGLGGALGMYGGLCAGLSAALILETVGGNIPVFSTVFCAGAGIFGAFVTKRLDAISLPGNRGRERMLRRYAPKAAVALLVLSKELLYIIYFFLTGVTISGIHIFRMVFSAVEAGVIALAVLPLVNWWITHQGKTRAERKAEKLAQKLTLPEQEAAPETEKKKRRRKRSFFDDLMVAEEKPEDGAPQDGTAAPEDAEVLEGWTLVRGDEPEPEDDPGAAQPPEKDETETTNTVEPDNTTEEEASSQKEGWRREESGQD